MTRHDVLYRRWVGSEAAIQVLLALLVVFVPGAWAPAAIANVAFMPAQLFVTLRRSEPGPVSAADAVTALRHAVALSATILVAIGLSRPIVMAVLFAAGACTDFVDGYLARSGKSSRFGALWDMETDAVYGAAMAHVLVVVFGYSPLFLLLGLMRYLFFLGTRRNPVPDAYPPWYRLFSKSVAAAIATTQVGAMFLGAAGAARAGTILMTLMLACQCTSFALEYRFIKAGSP